MTNDPQTARSGWRRFFIVATSGLLIVFTLFVMAFAWICSPSGSSFILNKVKQTVEKDPQNHFEFSSGSLAPLSGLHFVSLHIVRDQALGDGQMHLEVDIDKVDVDYHLSIWDRRLEIAGIKVLRPRIKVRINKAHDTPPAPEKPSQPSSISPEERLRHPPIEVVLRDLSITGFDLDFEDTTGASDRRLQLRALNLQMALSLVRDQIETSGDLKMSDPLHMAVKDLTQALSLDAALAAHWHINVHRENGEWIYQVDPSSIAFHLAHLDLEQMAPEANTHVLMPQLQLNSDFNLRAQTAELLHLNADAVKTVAAKSELRVGDVHVSKMPRNGAKTEPLDVNIAAQDLMLDTSLGREIAVDLAYHMRELTMPAQLLKPLNVELTSKGLISRALTHADFDTKVKFAGLEALRLKAATEIAADLKTLTTDGHLDLMLDPSLADTVKSASSLKKTGAIQAGIGFKVARDAKSVIKARFQADVPHLAMAAVKTPIALQLGGDAVYDQPAAHLDFDGHVEFTNQTFGKWTLVSKFNLTQKPDPKPDLLTDGTTTITQLQPGTGAGAPPVKMKAPFSLEHHVALTAKKADVDIHFHAPQMDVTGVASLADTDVRASIKTPDFASARDMDFILTAKQGAIQLVQKKSGAMPLSSIKGLEVDIKGELRDKVRFTLERFNAAIDGTALQLHAQATANTATRDAQGQLQVSVKIPESFPEVSGQKIGGQVEIPAQISIYRGQEIALNGAVELANLSWRKEKFSVTGITGRFPFSEKIIWDGTNARFASLINENPFARVDFERVRPLLDGHQSLRIDQIGWEEKTYGPFVGFFSLTQNMFYAHQFDLDMATGHVAGEMFFDAYPANLQLGVLSRMTGLNLAEILPRRFLSRMPEGDKKVSGRSGFVLNLKRGTMDGRVDVTEIGGPQLVAMINTVDPNYQDEKMNKLRSLLNLGYPTHLALAFAEGFMDMNVGLKVLGVTQEENVREIPVSSLLANATAGIVQQSEKGPLK